MRRYVDRTSLNLAALLIGGSGLLVALTKFNIPQLNMAFFDESPYAIKRGVIDGTMTWLFTVLTLIGLLIRIIVEIVGEGIPLRLRSTRFYLGFCLTGLVLMISLVWGLTKIGYGIAREKWFPKIVNNQKASFEFSKFIVSHDWLNEQELATRDRLSKSDLDERRHKNHEQVEKNLNQIEELFEMHRTSDDLTARIEALKSIFRP